MTLTPTTCSSASGSRVRRGHKTHISERALARCGREIALVCGHMESTLGEQIIAGIIAERVPSRTKAPPNQMMIVGRLTKA
jgi:hypothetical protein